MSRGLAPVLYTLHNVSRGLAAVLYTLAMAERKLSVLPYFRAYKAMALHVRCAAAASQEVMYTSHLTRLWVENHSQCDGINCMPARRAVTPRCTCVHLFVQRSPRMRVASYVVHLCTCCTMHTSIYPCQSQRLVNPPPMYQ